MELKAVAFDLGGTLVRYYERNQFSGILAEALGNVYALVSDQASVSLQEAQDNAMDENRERTDCRVCPVHERLVRIFGISQLLSRDVRQELAIAFLKPIFACARKYDDVDQVLLDLRQQGHRLAIVSNTPWGTPSEQWREELERHRLRQSVDVSLFCVDVGWRKPAHPIFEAVLSALDVGAGETVFVGDSPRWDCEGSKAAGMVPVLIDRNSQYTEYVGNRIRSLNEFPGLLQWFIGRQRTDEQVRPLRYTPPLTLVLDASMYQP